MRFGQAGGMVFNLISITPMRYTLNLVLVLAALSLNACRTPSAVAVQTPSPPMYDWHGDEVPGPLKVKINLSEQKAQLFKGMENVGWTYVATGVSSRPTPTGTFSVIEKKADKASNRFGVIVDANGSIVNGDATNGVSPVPAGGRFVGASMPHWMRLTNYGIGMHEGYIPNPGSTASHGCIRLPAYMAEKLFENAVQGTCVSIYP